MCPMPSLATHVAEDTGGCSSNFGFLNYLSNSKLLWVALTLEHKRVVYLQLCDGQEGYWHTLQTQLLLLHHWHKLYAIIYV